MAISTTYGNGGMTTSTEAGAYPTSASGDDFWRQLAARRQQHVAPPPPAPVPQPREFTGDPRAQPRGGGRSARPSPPPSERAPSAVEMAAERAKLAELRAISEPAPTRMTT